MEKQIITIEKIDVTTLINNRISEVEDRDKQREFLRNKRVLKLTPYIAQALFGMVEIHNRLIEKGSGRLIFNLGIIENANEFVNEFLNCDARWSKTSISDNKYTNVSFKLGDLQIWLSDNIGCMRYTSNPIYQIYGSYDVKDFLNSLIVKYFK